jgi:hypothetical protein
MANTEITYIYRDGSNYQKSCSVVVAGNLRFDEIQPCLDGNEWFIASQVGLPDPQLQWALGGYKFPTEDDHVWCELGDGDIEPTDEAPTCNVTAADLLARFVKASQEGWDVAAASARLGIGGGEYGSGDDDAI